MFLRKSKPDLSKYLSLVSNLYENIVDVNTLCQSETQLFKVLVKISKLIKDNYHRFNNNELRGVHDTLSTLCSTPRIKVNDKCYALSDFDSVSSLVRSKTDKIVGFEFLRGLQQSINITILTEHILMLIDAICLKNLKSLKLKFLAKGNSNKVFCAYDGADRIAVRYDKFYGRYFDPISGWHSEKIQFVSIGSRTGSYRRTLAVQAVQKLMLKLGAPEVMLPMIPAIITNKSNLVVWSMPRLRKGHLKMTAENIRRLTWLQLQDC